MMGRGKCIDSDWLAEHYPMMTDINKLLDDFELEFGWRPAKTAVYVKANRLGIKKKPIANHDGRAERTVRWSKEPEMEAWMLKHDHGQRSDVLSDAFRGRWGFGLSRKQITQFRQSHGTSTRKNNGGGRPLAPLGAERKSKDGMIIVKVAERASISGSKDNWRLKHVVIWERANGRPLPKGYNVYFADGDTTNYDPENLVAVKRRLIGVLNQMRSQGVTWHDRESLQACIALAEVKIARNDALAAKRRICPCCGKEFDNTTRNRYTVRAKTCPECIKAGRRPPGCGTRVVYDRELIKRMYADGMRNVDIANELGCSTSTVSFAINDIPERRKEERRKKWMGEDG